MSSQMHEMNIVIAEDNLRNLDIIQEKLSGFNILFVAENGAILLEELKQRNILPDLILMDIEMPILNGIEATRQIKEIYPEIKILAVTVFDDDERILNMILAGASGYILKDTSKEDMVRAIHELANGGAPMSPSIAYKILRHLKGISTSRVEDDRVRLLTKREREILELIKEGLQNKEIADNLFISVPTVRKHIENIYTKLHVNNRVEAIRKIT